MSLAPRDWRRIVVSSGLMCAMGAVSAGCGDTLVNSGVAHPGGSLQRPAESAVSIAPDAPISSAPSSDAAADSASPGEAQVTDPVDPQSSAANADSSGNAATTPANNPARPRAFVAERPDGALRIGFDDLDLMKLINMDPVTSDCIEKMPEWLKDMNGKLVRIRGYMKPSGITEGIPRFVFVRSTDLCCFGPKGKVYHLIAVTLKPGTTTDYIELKPFDVTGTFRIEKVELDEGLIYLLYHIDDAAIHQK